MPSSIQIGSILIKEQPFMAERLGLETDSYSQNWSVVRAVNGFSLDRKIRESGWSSFFMAAEVQANAFGTIRAGSLRAALRRIFSKVRDEDFNCLEVTGIVARSLLGIPYVVVSAHSRNIQKAAARSSPRTAGCAEPGGVGQRLRRSSSQATIGVAMSAQADRKKWCICQVHQYGFPDAPYCNRLPQYGPWEPNATLDKLATCSDGWKIRLLH
jgi:hypothetical protein